MKVTEELSYSLDALRVKALFYGKKAMVYVEGPEDINFWDPYFDREIFEIESVGGCENLNLYIEKLEEGETSYIVACDADYNAFINKSAESPMVVRTYGYSIENTMYCPYKLSEVVRKLSRSKVDTTLEFNGWYQKFVSSAHPLLVREIVNKTFNPKEDKPVVFGKTCANYCNVTSPNYELDDARIKKFCDENKSLYPQKEIDRVEMLIAADNRDERYLIKGHFITEGVRRYVNYLSSCFHPTGSKCNISSLELYALTINCTGCLRMECNEKQFLQNSVAIAITNLVVA